MLSEVVLSHVAPMSARVNSIGKQDMVACSSKIFISPELIHVWQSVKGPEKKAMRTWMSH